MSEILFLPNNYPGAAGEQANRPADPAAGQETHQPNPGRWDSPNWAEWDTAAMPQVAGHDDHDNDSYDHGRAYDGSFGRPDTRRNTDDDEGLDILDSKESAEAVEDDNLDGLGDVDAAIAADTAAANNARSHRRKRDWSKLRYLNPAEAARHLKARWETSGPKEKAKIATRVGAIALGVYVVGEAIVRGYAAYKGYSLNNSGSAAATLQEHLSGAADQPAVTEAVIDNASAPDTSTGGVKVGGVVPEQVDTTTYQREATGHDVSGRVSNVTDWSRETIREEALKAGLSEDQANALARDQHNIDLTNQAFYNQNEAVANDARHYMDAGDTYNTTGQHHSAQDIIDQYKAEHNIVDTPAQNPDTQTGTGNTQPAADTAANTDAGTSALNMAPEITPPVKHEGNKVLTASASVLAGIAGGMATVATVNEANKFAARRRTRDLEAEYQMFDDLDDAAVAGRAPEDIRNHRTRRGGRRRRTNPVRHEKPKVNTNPKEAELEPAARID